jgi:hypothetical protein
MTNSWDWAERIFSEDELDDLSSRTDRIIYDNENGFIVNIALTNEQCMDLVENWWTSQDDTYGVAASIVSFEYIEHFLADFMWFLEIYLDDNHSGWRERRFGLDDY